MPEESTSKARLDADFSELYKAHLKDVYSYSYYRVGNHHDAEDLTEQTFLQAYRHFARAQEESQGRPLRPWLMRFALDMDNREIARALDRTDGATKVLLHRAIRQLEDIVQADMNGDGQR